MAPAAYNQQSGVVRSLREAGTQLFGDPSQPDFKSLASYAHLADDPHTQQKVGTALAAYMNDIVGHIEGSGGLWQAVQTDAGIPKYLAESKQRLQEKIRNEGWTPEEQDLMAKEMSAIESSIAIRSLTKASAAKFSADALKETVPMIGVNTPNSRVFADKMSALAEQIYNGSSTGIDPRLFRPEERKFYKDQVKKFSNQTDTPKAYTGPIKTAADLLNKYPVATPK